MAHKKGLGSSKNGRDSNPKYRGVKVFGGSHIKAGGIIVRQVGTVIHPGSNVGLGRDFTLFALKDGRVKFDKESRNHVLVIFKQLNDSAEVSEIWNPLQVELPKQ